MTRNGTFVWEELMTSDIAAARDFYGKVLGWKAEELPISEDMTYTMWSAGGQQLAGGMQSSEMPPVWASYIGVESADKWAAQAKELGATIVKEPFDVMDVGRMAVIQDPAGAYVCIWEATGRENGAPAEGVGSVSWIEHRSKDIEAAKKFYGAWMDWTFESRDMGGDMLYEVIMLGDQQVGGMFLVPDSMGDMPAHWGVIFEVDDADAAYKNAVSLGASTQLELVDIPKVGRYAGLADPQGAWFGILAPANN
jgi:predicted enzyme related to lactoylglutathione lyase